VKLPATNGKAMKIYRILIPAPSAFSQIGDLFKNVKGLLGGGELSESKIIQGLKALGAFGLGLFIYTVVKMMNTVESTFNLEFPLAC
jgi:hypothetical protein